MDQSKSSVYKNSKTTSRGFRITHTQNYLLSREQRKGDRASAIIRVLLDLYFGGRISEAEVLVQAELEKATKAKVDRIERLRRKIA